MSSIRLRKASLDDLAALVELEYAAFPGDWISRRSWRDLLTSPAALVTIAQSGHDSIGSCVLLTNTRTSVARIYSIAVSGKARRRGVAKLLIEASIEHAEAHGANVCRLETRVDNTSAQALFEAMGFEAFARSAHYYQDGVDAIRYERQLMATRRTAGAVR
jgi:ribosomal protein S18 acetylase RimI-like enzyme